MKIAFTSKGEGWESAIDPRFGRTEFISVFDEENNELSIIDNHEVEQQEHGAGPITAQKLYNIHAEILITGNGPGKNAALVLQNTNTKIYIGAGSMTVKQAYDAYKDQKLTEF